MARATGLDVLCQLDTETAKTGHHHAVMRQLNVANRGDRRFAAVKRVFHPCGQQPILDRIESLGAFWVAAAHLVFAAVLMGEITSRVHCVNILG
jgi:hypothetical protein